MPPYGKMVAHQIKERVPKRKSYGAGQGGDSYKVSGVSRYKDPERYYRAILKRLLEADAATTITWINGCEAFYVEHASVTSVSDPFRAALLRACNDWATEKYGPELPRNSWEMVGPRTYGGSHR